MKIIEINGLNKTFGKTKALNELTLTVEKGNVYGFIGPNGAGKTTTIRVLLGILRKTSGEVSLFGGDPYKDAVSLHQRLAYVPGDVSLWPNLTGGEVIDLLGKLHGGIDKAKRQKYLDLFQLDPKKKCRTYSKGNRQKVALVAAFSCNSELLLLDEPTSGLDPLMEQIFQSCVQDAKNQGKTILLSSHILSEVETLCDRVGIIRQGQIVDTGTLADMRHLTRIQVIVQTETPVQDWAGAAGVHDISQDDGKWRLMVDSGSMEDVMRFVLPFGIKSFTAEPPTLEELFMRHYNNSDGGIAQ